MKILLIALLISTLGNSQVEIDTSLTFVEENMILSPQAAEALSIRFSPEIDYEKQFWDNEKEKLSHLLKEYLEVKEKRIVGYSFIEPYDENSASIQQAYFTNEKKYAPVYNTLWIHGSFFSRKEALEDLKIPSYAKNIIRDITINYTEVEAIYIEKEKTLTGFYKWLTSPKQ